MRVRTSVFICVIAAAGVAFSSCVTHNAADFDALAPGLTAAQLAQRLGSPDMLIGEVTTAYGQHVTAWEYEKNEERSS